MRPLLKLKDKSHYQLTFKPGIIKRKANCKFQQLHVKYILHGFERQPGQKEIMSHEHVCVRLVSSTSIPKIEFECIHVRVISRWLWYESCAKQWDYFGGVLTGGSSWTGPWKTLLYLSRWRAHSSSCFTKTSSLVGQRGASGGDEEHGDDWGDSAAQLFEFTCISPSLSFLQRKK